MSKKFFIISVISVLISAISGNALAQETITITTYYPSPYGTFVELRTNRLAVSATRAMPTTDGTLAWGDYRGLLSPDQGASIELGGSGTPYIDFSNDAAIDYDARIILPNNDTLRINVNNKLVVRNIPNTNWRDIEVKCVKYNSSAINPNPPHSGDICKEGLIIIP